MHDIWNALTDFLGLQYGFMQRAYLALLLLTPLLALFGSMAVNKRMAFFSDALGHSALAGVGIGMLLGISDVTLVLIVFGLGFALVINRINKMGGADSDTNISVFSSMGIALGLVLLSKNGNFSKYTTLLTGDVLAISQKDIYILLSWLVFGACIWIMVYNKVLLTAINPSLAQSRGIRSSWMEKIFVCLVAVAVMLSIRWVGVLLINALLILPAAAARNIAKSARQHTLFALLISVFSGFVGLFSSYHMEGTSAGASIVIVAGICYALSLLFRRIHIKKYV